MKISFEISKGSKSATTQNKTANRVKTKGKQPASRQRKLIIIGVYIATLVWVITAGSNPSRLYLAKTYTNDKNSFSIRPPKHWQTLEGQNSNIVEFSDPQFPTNRISVNSQPTTSPLADFINQAKNKLPQIYPGYKLLDEYDAKVQGQPVHILDGQVPIDGVLKRNRVMVELKGGNAYVVSASTAVNNWEVNKLTLDASLRSFKTLH